MSKKSLPVMQSSLHADGRRNYVHPADVSGRFTRARRVVFAVLLAIYLVLPFVRIGGRPAVFLDIAHRRFFLLGASFNAQDFWLVFFLLTGIALLLFIATTLWGRVWCGFACPQTVFLEGVYRRVERWIEGPRVARLRRNAGPWTKDKVLRKGATQLTFVALSVFFAHVFLSYFVSLPSLVEMVGRSPAEHPEAFGWMLGMSALVYFNFAWFREQLCMILCPYGRLQSTLLDKDTRIVGYDVSRGEPRGKTGKKRKNDSGAVGDCVDCGRCVQVCPTGIDIRNGLQLECVGCTACIDACDAIMERVGRPRGLVRYDSMRGFAGEPRGRRRSRLLLYAGALVLWGSGLALALSGHEAYEANLLRPPGGAPFVVRDDVVQNTLRLHIVNKRDRTTLFRIEAPGAGELEYVVPTPDVSLRGGGSRHVVVLVRRAQDLGPIPRGLEAQLRVVPDEGEARAISAPFLGPEQ